MNLVHGLGVLRHPFHQRVNVHTEIDLVAALAKHAEVIAAFGHKVIHHHAVVFGVYQRLAVQRQAIQLGAAICGLRPLKAKIVGDLGKTPWPGRLRQLTHNQFAQLGTGQGHHDQLIAKRLNREQITHGDRLAGLYRQVSANAT